MATQQAIADLAGVKQPAVSRAVRRGLIDLHPDGSIDEHGSQTMAWLDSHRAKAMAPSVDTLAARLTERSGSLREREYDLAMLAANTVNRAELRAVLMGEAAEWMHRMVQFPGELAELLSPALRLPLKQVGGVIAACMADYLLRRDPEPEIIERALEHAASRWRLFPPRHMRHPPPLPEFTAPVSLNDALDRSAKAKAAQVDLRVRTRAGELLAKGAADMAAGGLRIGWVQASGDEWAAVFVPLLLSRFGLAGQRELAWACETVAEQHVACRIAPIWPDLVRGVPTQFLAQAEDVLLEHRTGLKKPVEALGATQRGDREAHAAAVVAWREQAKAMARPPSSEETA